MGDVIPGDIDRACDYAASKIVRESAESPTGPFMLTTHQSTGVEEIIKGRILEKVKPLFDQLIGERDYLKAKLESLDRMLEERDLSEQVEADQALEVDDGRET